MLPALLEGLLKRATLIRTDGPDIAYVSCEEGSSDEVECDILSTSEKPLDYDPGDVVLVWRPGSGERGVVLGRLGARQNLDAREGDGDVPEELTLEARQSLTLRVGQGSITIREDGKILIKGKDLVSHATRMNRIRGGSVSIN
jgi:hypothetical protein